MAADPNRHKVYAGPFLVSASGAVVYRPATREDLGAAVGARGSVSILALDTAGLPYTDNIGELTEPVSVARLEGDTVYYGVGGREVLVTADISQFTGWAQQHRADWPATIYVVALGRLGA
jgi:hypothetical protein